MSENHKLTTRSGALKRLALLAGGAVGAIAGGRALGADRGEAATLPAGATPAQEPVDVVLYGRNWRLGSHKAEHGKAPKANELRTPTGRIVDAKGKHLGTFKAANVLGFGGALQLQTFDLVDGTIVGIGAGGHHESPFAIVGRHGPLHGRERHLLRQAVAPGARRRRHGGVQADVHHERGRRWHLMHF
jgi:hypothetical protein